MDNCIYVYDNNISDIDGHDFNKTPFFHVKGEIVYNGFEATPPIDYELPNKYPKCCEWHSSTLRGLVSWFDKFPNCCKWHKELSAKHWFNKESYSEIPMKISKSLLFTEHHIQSKINEENWLYDISCYIEYNLQSFGTPGIGANRYLIGLRHYVKSGKLSFWTKEKRKLLLEYIDDHIEPKNVEITDLNLLYITFQTWINSLPNLAIFSNFKKKYLNKIPPEFLFGSAEYNPYLEQTKFKPRTRKQLLTILISYTKDALSKIDSALLLADGTISDVAIHQLELAGSKRKLKQDALLGQYSKGERKYVDVIQQWLVNEEEYFASVNTLLASSSILPHLPRTGLPAHVENHFNLGESGTLQMIQGDNATQHNNPSI